MPPLDMADNHRENRIRCCIPDCDASIPDNYWSKVKAAGWYFKKDGLCFCPMHIPRFVRSSRYGKK